MSIENETEWSDKRDVKIVSIVGSGGMAQIHTKAILRLFSTQYPKNSIKIGYIVSRSAQSAEKLLPYLEDAPMMMSSVHCLGQEDVQRAFQDTDLVIIASPDDQHDYYVSAAIQASIKKPMAPSADRITNLFEDALTENCLLLCGFQRRKDPSFLMLKRALTEKRVGEIETIHIMSRDPNADDFPVGVDMSANDIKAVLFNSLIHDFDMAIWLTESVDQTTAPIVEEIYATCVGCQQTFTIVITFKINGTLCIIEYSRERYGYDQRTEVICSEGILHVDNHTTSQLEYEPMYNNVKAYGVDSGTNSAIAPAKKRFHQHWSTRYADAYVNQMQACLDLVFADDQGTGALEPTSLTRIMEQTAVSYAASARIAEQVATFLITSPSKRTQSPTSRRVSRPVFHHVPPPITHVPTRKPTDAKVNVCIVGAGRMGHIRCETLINHPNTHLKVIVDPSLKARNVLKVACDTWLKGSIPHAAPPSLYDDLRAALAGKDGCDIDLVWIACGTVFHHDCIKVCAEFGVPVYCEKPISDNIDNLLECYRIMTENGLPLMACWNRRQDPSCRKLAGHLESLYAKTDETTSKTLPIRLVSCAFGDNPAPHKDVLLHLGSIYHDVCCHVVDYFLNTLCPIRDGTSVSSDTLEAKINADFSLPNRVYATGATTLEDLRGSSILDTGVMLTTTYPCPDGPFVLCPKDGVIMMVKARRRSLSGYDERIEVLNRDGTAIHQLHNPIAAHGHQDHISGSMAMDKTDVPLFGHPDLLFHGYQATTPVWHYSFPQRFREAFIAEIGLAVDTVRRYRLLTKKPPETSGEAEDTGGLMLKAWGKEEYFYEAFENFRVGICVDLALQSCKSGQEITLD